MSLVRMPPLQPDYETTHRPLIPGKSVSFVQSLRYAGRGVRQAFRTEINLRAHLLVFLLVIVLGVGLGISPDHWALLVLTSLTVVSFELMNSALEAFADAVHPTYHVNIAKAKDIAAGAVLTVSIAAVAVGMVIFGVPLLRLLVG